MALTCDMPVEELDLSLRTYFCLKRADVRSAADLVALPAESIVGTFDSVPESLRELCDELNIHARGLLQDPNRYTVFARLPVSAIGLSPEIESQLISSGICTLGGLSETVRAKLHEILGRGEADAILVKLWAYCVVRGRDKDEPSGPPLIGEPMGLDAILGCQEGETDSIGSDEYDSVTPVNTGGRRREDTLFRVYLSDMSRLPPLNRADEVLLAARIARAGGSARERTEACYDLSRDSLRDSQEGW